MTLSQQTQAVLLLTAHFSKAEADTLKPLTPSEWGRFAAWLNDNNLTPDSLLDANALDLLTDWTDKTISTERVEQLLNRGSALALAVEKWSRAGLWVLTRSDADYPQRLKKLLKTNAPPVLFGCGNAKLLSQGGIAVVGSRQVSADELHYTSELSALATHQGFSIISGGAKGVDETAMHSALQQQGTVVGVLADSLQRAATSASYRHALLQNALVLISPFYPDAGFNTGNAMARNKYIYCLADAAIVVHSGTTGGTWSGAMENLKKAWIPLWVKPTSDETAGNAALVDKGGRWLSDIAGLEFASLLKTPDNEPVVVTEIDDIFAIDNAAEQEIPLPDNSFYDLFLLKLQQLTRNQAKSADELATALNITKTQVNIWLQQGLTEQKIKKLNKPVRYFATIAADKNALINNQ